jgi:hypothetical protein
MCLFTQHDLAGQWAAGRASQYPPPPPPPPPDPPDPCCDQGFEASWRSGGGAQALSTKCKINMRLSARTDMIMERPLSPVIAQIDGRVWLLFRDIFTSTTAFPTCGDCRIHRDLCPPQAGPATCAARSPHRPAAGGLSVSSSALPGPTTAASCAHPPHNHYSKCYDHDQHGNHVFHRRLASCSMRCNAGLVARSSTTTLPRRCRAHGRITAPAGGAPRRSDLAQQGAAASQCKKAAEVVDDPS